MYKAILFFLGGVLVVMSLALLYDLWLVYGSPGVLWALPVLGILGYLCWRAKNTDRTLNFFLLADTGRPLKDSNKGCGNIGSGTETTDGGSTVGSSDSLYPNESTRYFRDQLKDLRESKADKAVVKSEIRRVQDRIQDATDDVDDIKAQLLVEKPHVCVQSGELGKMKKAIEANEKTSHLAMKTASLASDRGFKILMGAVAGLVTFGVAFIVWAVNVGHTASEAYEKADRAEQSAAKAKTDKPPPQIFIADPKYFNDRSKKSTSSQSSQEGTIQLEAVLERAFTRALENSTDPSHSEDSVSDEP